MINDVSWVLTRGEAGHRSQALGLAEAVGLPVEEKRIVVRAPWSWIPGGLLPLPLSTLGPGSDPLLPPWPRLVVGCGRRSIGATLAVKRLSGGRTVAAYVQNPGIARAKFDLVVALAHDDVRGPNVVVTKTALNPVTAERLASARDEWRARLAPQGRPLLGVLVGGDNGKYRLTAAVTARLVRILIKAHAEHGASVAVTPSRRTDDATKKALKTALAAEHLGMMWDESGENPYFGVLALADRLIVTGESVSMISEALATGRPVHLLRLEGHGPRHHAFLTGIVQSRMASLIEGDDLDWNFPGHLSTDPTAEPVARLRTMLGFKD